MSSLRFGVEVPSGREEESVKGWSGSLIRAAEPDAPVEQVHRFKQDPSVKIMISAV